MRFALVILCVFVLAAVAQAQPPVYVPQQVLVPQTNWEPTTVYRPHVTYQPRTVYQPYVPYQPPYYRPHQQTTVVTGLFGIPWVRVHRYTW